MGPGRQELRGTEKGIVIIGALGQIGRALAEHVADSHESVTLVDIDKGSLLSLAGAIEHRGGAHPTTLVINQDSDDPGREISDFLESANHQPRYLVNAAYPGKRLLAKSHGVGDYSPFDVEFVTQHFQFFLSITTTFSRYLEFAGGGSITNISSMYGSVTPHFNIYEGTNMSLPVGYGAAKSAIETMSRHLAAYYRSSGVRINCVAPGGIAQGQSDRFVKQYGARTITKTLLQAGDVLGTIELLASEAGRAITGQTILVDDGFSIA